MNTFFLREFTVRTYAMRALPPCLHSTCSFGTKQPLHTTALACTSVYTPLLLCKPAFTHHSSLQASVDSAQPLCKAVFTNRHGCQTPPHAVPTPRATPAGHSFAARTLTRHWAIFYTPQVLQNPASRHRGCCIFP